MEADQIPFLSIKNPNKVLPEYSIALKEIRSLLNELFQKFKKPSHQDYIEYDKLKNLGKNISLVIENLSKNVIDILDLVSQDNMSSYEKSNLEWDNKDFAKYFKYGVDSCRLNPINKSEVFKELQIAHNKLAIQLIDTLQKGILEGKILTKIFKDIKSIINYERDKILVIYLTEVHSVQMIERLTGVEKTNGAAERLGLESKKVWVAVNDNRTKPDHFKMAGVASDKNGVFTLPDGSKTVSPGLTGKPEHDEGCSCTFENELSGFENVPPIMTFEEWSKNKSAINDNRTNSLINKLI